MTGPYYVAGYTKTGTMHAMRRRPNGGTWVGLCGLEADVRCENEPFDPSHRRACKNCRTRQGKELGAAKVTDPPPQRATTGEVTKALTRAGMHQSLRSGESGAYVYSQGFEVAAFGGSVRVTHHWGTSFTQAAPSARSLAFEPKATWIARYAKALADAGFAVADAEHGTALDVRR